MNEIDSDRYQDIINKNNKTEQTSIKKHLKGILVRILIVFVIFFSSAIACNYNDKFKDSVIEYVFTDSISFIKMKNIYNKFLGGLLPIKKEVATRKVFNEKLDYSNLSLYYDGVNLTVSENYLVPALKEGMVVFIGNKDNYGNTVIIEDLNGVYIWYGNISTTSLKMYDYVEAGAYVGEVNKNLYMVFSRDNKYLGYEEYLN